MYINIFFKNFVEKDLLVGRLYGDGTCDTSCQMCTGTPFQFAPIVGKLERADDGEIFNGRIATQLLAIAVGRRVESLVFV